MKASTLFFLVSISFLCSSMFGQETIWLDENLKEAAQFKADYYKIGEKTNGEVSYYYKNKNIFRKFVLVNGKIEGNYFEYYNSGELRESGVYESGLREGVWKTYSKDGKIQSRGKYSKGEKAGIWKIFYKNI
jgi:antitoxin component YwqK of YwqJK toxin-antitoxin module